MRLPKSWKKVYILLLVSARQFYKNFRNEFKDVELELYDANKVLQLWFHGLSILIILLALVSLLGTIGFELESPYTYWHL